MRPILHPALSRTWRDESTLQLGATPGLASVVGGLSRPERAVVEAMTGTADLAALRELAAEVGLRRSAADHLTNLLLAAGAVVDADRLDTADPRRLPDRSSAALLIHGPDGGDDVLAARAGRRVDVHGAGRVGAQLARLLAAAGVGTVAVLDSAAVRPADVSPGGHPPDAVGAPRRRALGPLLRADAGDVTGDDAPGSPPRPRRRTAGVGRATAPGRHPSGRAPGHRAPATPGRRTATPHPPSAPDVAVLTPTGGTGREEAAELVRQGIAHLFAQVVEVTGVVGPLVLPGRSSCLRCQDLHRTDRDPHWPLVLDQTLRRPPPEPACDTALAAVVAGLAATQVLAHLDGFVPAAVDGTIEVTLPSGLPRRRSWTRHPRCGCGWATLEGEAAQWET